MPYKGLLLKMEGFKEMEIEIDERPLDIMGEGKWNVPCQWRASQPAS